MRRVLIAAVLVATPASAQIASPITGHAPGPLTTYEQPRTTYDYRSGNTYRVTPSYGGGARVSGYNTQTGSTWNTQIRPNGSMRGTDSQGNYWTQDRSGNYHNFGNGRSCYGTGAYRTCY